MSSTSRNARSKRRQERACEFIVVKIVPGTVDVDQPAFGHLAGRFLAGSTRLLGCIGFQDMSKYIVKRHECSQYQLSPGVDSFTAAGNAITLSLVEFQPRAIIELHRHPHEQMGMLLEGELTFVIGDEMHVLGPGDMQRIPGNAE